MRDRFAREERALLEAALPHPDGRRVADRAAALQQRRPHGAAGARRGDRRHPVAAHQLARRGAGAADRGSRDAGAADAADHRARERRHQRRRSARRIVLRRAADARHGARGAATTSTIIDRMGGMVEAIEQGFPQREIAEASYRFQQAVERATEDHRRGQRLRAGGRGAVSRSSTSTRRTADRQLARLEELRRTRDNDRGPPRARVR